ncbi:hypothetical protein HY732_00550, partial [Candidatus Uhrbacteria bacterium]|nr:hypothetical protein [Candidatus Uhrbacteria bacterium]
PLTREQALAKGYRWQDELQSTRGKETLPSSQIPDDIVDVKEEILQQILACDACQKNFKLVKQELAFYKKFSIPIPHLCHDCRYKEHLSLRQPRKLFDGRCMCAIRSHDHGTEQCPHTFQTPYPAEAQRIIYCEQCYQKEVI